MGTAGWCGRWLVGLAMVLGGCGSSAPRSADAGVEVRPEVRQSDIAGLKAAMGAGDVALIDVRTIREFAAGHVPGAVNIPLHDLASQVPALKGLDRELWLICQSGNRSGRAARMLAAEGVPTVNVQGGTRAWTAAGHEIRVP